MAQLKVSAAEVDLNDLEFWAKPPAYREAAFAALRRDNPIAHFPEPEYQLPGMIPGSGYYALTKYRDVIDASRQPNLFCSGKGATSVPDLPEQMLDFFGSMINMDDPRHKRLRDIVNKAFTVRQVRQIYDYVDKTAIEICEAVGPKGEVDFVTEVSSRLPLKVICDMMGVPSSHYDFVFDRSNTILGAADPEYVPQDDDQQNILTAIMNAAVELTQLMTDLAQQRQDEPTDDVTSALIHAEVDGDKLSNAELASFFILLVVAGNETTRNAISWGLKLLTEHPDQREIWRNDFDGLQRSAIEEIVRYSSPVVYMRRTVTEDGATLSDHVFEQGDKVLLYYNSANRDEDVFDDPDTFNVRRNINPPQVGFGGPGPHFCLGANLARQEIKVMFQELFRRIPDIEVSGEADHLRSNFINGIKHLPAKFTPVSG